MLAMAEPHRHLGDIIVSDTTTRSYIDCRDVPSESGCSLRISGSRDEVLTAAVDHAVASHGHARTSELHDMIASAIAEEPAPSVA
jgi:predicted small metal-binding protein